MNDKEWQIYLDSLKTTDPEWSNVANEPGVQDTTVLDFLLPFLAIPGIGQTASKTPIAAKETYSVLKGLGTSGKATLGQSGKEIAGTKALSKGLQFLAEPEELAVASQITRKIAPKVEPEIEYFVKGVQKGLKGEEIPIYGVRGPADKLKAAFGDANPGSVTADQLKKAGLMAGAPETTTALDIAAQKALMLAEESGGATFNLTKGNLAGTPHYAVSVYPERELILKSEPTTKAIEAYMEKNKDLLMNPENSFGIWTNSKGQKVLDVVITIPDKEKALELAAANKQDAIWDLLNMKEIKVPKGK